MINCTFENGNKNSLRHVVVDMLVVKDNKILLIKRAPQLSNGNKYALVGGFVERDEDTKQAALREVLEETGYKARVVSLFRLVDNPDRINEDRQNISFVYLIEPLEKVGDHDWEVIRAQWFDLDKLPNANEIAFDHLETIKYYIEYIKKPFPIPIIGRMK